MSTKLTLLELYTSILDCSGCVVDREGFVSGKIDDQQTPLLVSGKRLVMPTQAHLMHGDSTNQMVFHPLCENVLQPQSDVITKLRQIYNIKLNYAFVSIAHSLLFINASIAEHPKLSPEQSEMLSFIKDVDQKTVDTFLQIMATQMKAAPDRAFVNIYLKPAGILNGRKYSRVGVVTFTAMEELLKDQEKYFGVKLRVKDKAALIQLHNYMFPNLETPNYYSRGSDSDVAPYLDALMQTVKAVASKVNDTLALFGDFIDNLENIKFSSDWVESFDNLVAYMPEIRMIPMQAGNDGKVQVQAQPVVAVVNAPVYQMPAPAQTTVFGVPVPAAIPWQQAPVVQQPPALVVTDKGVDFQSMIRSNPMLAANVPQNNPFQQQIYQQGNQPSAPSWASNQNTYARPSMYNQTPNYGNVGGFGQGIV